MLALEKVRRGIAARAKAQGMSLRAMARQSDLDVATVSRIITGVCKSPDWDACEKIAATLGTTLVEIIAAEEKSLRNVTTVDEARRARRLQSA